MRASVNITNTILQDIIEDITDPEVKNIHDIKHLLLDVFKENETASVWLTKLKLGTRYPYHLKPGVQGFLAIDRGSLSWSQYKGLYQNSSYNQQGYIPCAIVAFHGLAKYSQLDVKLPSIKNEKDELIEPHLSITIDEFIDRSDPDDMVIDTIVALLF